MNALPQPGCSHANGFCAGAGEGGGKHARRRAGSAHLARVRAHMPLELGVLLERLEAKATHVLPGHAARDPHPPCTCQPGKHCAASTQRPGTRQGTHTHTAVQPELLGSWAGQWEHSCTPPRRHALGMSGLHSSRCPASPCHAFTLARAAGEAFGAHDPRGALLCAALLRPGGRGRRCRQASILGGTECGHASLLPAQCRAPHCGCTTAAIVVGTALVAGPVGYAAYLWITDPEALQAAMSRLPALSGVAQRIEEQLRVRQVAFDMQVRGGARGWRR